MLDIIDLEDKVWFWGIQKLKVELNQSVVLGQISRVKEFVKFWINYQICFSFFICFVVVSCFWDCDGLRNINMNYVSFLGKNMLREDQMFYNVKSIYTLL